MYGVQYLNSLRRLLETPTTRTIILLLQGLGVVVVAAVAFLAVAQQQLRQLDGVTVGNETVEALEAGDETFVGDGGSSGSSYHGLVGLSLTYALPIVGKFCY